MYYYHLFASSSAYMINEVISFSWRRRRTAENTFCNKQQLKQKQHRSSKLCRNMRVNV